jgi:hypothetical protein
MPPVVLLVLIWIAVRGFWDGAAGQARIEGRRAGTVIRDELARRATPHARKLAKRLEDGRKAGRVNGGGWWWAWAGLTTARATWRGMRHVRRGAKASRGPLSRIARAGRDGNRAARQRKEAFPDSPYERLTPCAGCGFVTVPAVLNDKQLCGICARPITAPEPAPAPAPAPEAVAPPAPTAASEPASPVPAPEPAADKRVRYRAEDTVGQVVNASTIGELTDRARAAGGDSRALWSVYRADDEHPDWRYIGYIDGGSFGFHEKLLSPRPAPESAAVVCQCCGDEYLTSDVHAGGLCAACIAAGCLTHEDCQRPLDGTAVPNPAPAPDDRDLARVGAGSPLYVEPPPGPAATTQDGALMTEAPATPAAPATTEELLSDVRDHAAANGYEIEQPPAPGPDDYEYQNGQSQRAPGRKPRATNTGGTAVTDTMMGRRSAGEGGDAGTSLANSHGEYEGIKAGSETCAEELEAMAANLAAAHASPELIQATNELAEMMTEAASQASRCTVLLAAKADDVAEAVEGAGGSEHVADTEWHDAGD